MNRFFFARLQDDGRLSAPINPGYETREAAVAGATALLRLRGAAKIVLVEVRESIEVTASVKFMPLISIQKEKVQK